MVNRDRLVGGDDVVVEGGDGLEPAMARALRIERRGTDRVLHDGVLGEQGQPGLPITGLHRGHRCLAQLPGRGHDRTFPITSSANRRRLSSLVWSGSVSGPTA